MNNLKALVQNKLSLEKNNGPLLTKSSFPPKLIVFAVVFSIAGQAYAADGGAGVGIQDIVLGLITVTFFIALFAVYMVSDKLLTVARVRVRGMETLDEEGEMAIMPSPDELKPAKSSSQEGLTVDLSKGFDIRIAGKAKKVIAGDAGGNRYAVKPQDWVGMIPIPKLVVEVGATVKAGDKLFYDKYQPEIFYTAPVSGEVIEVNRAAKRAIAEVVILADKEVQFKDFGKKDPNGLSRDEVVNAMLESGIWPLVRQRPYNVVANPADTPKGIFISGYDSGPLAPNYNFTLAGEAEAFQAGIDALNKLTNTVHLSLNSEVEPNDTYANATGVTKHYFSGPHPSGNVGVQIHHIDAVNKGEVVWHINPQHVIFLGRLFTEGKYDTQHTFTLAGPVVSNPQYYTAYQGVNMEDLFAKEVNSEHVRYISGNVLSGTKIEKNGFKGSFDNLVTVIEEGDEPEFMGWLLPSYARPSISPTFPWTVFGGEDFDVTTNTHGEERAYVVTGQYESVLPMDILPVHLIKAIMARDFDQMEGLGIYEVAEEDFALCEFVCTSKSDVQEILREGLDYIKEQS